MDHISPLCFKFLSKLNQNNNREWFQLHRNLYDEAYSFLLQFTEHLLTKMSDFEPKLRWVEPKSCIFRIHRDARFSKDKSPYKTNFGVIFGDKKSKLETSGYYLHIDPKESFLAGGVRFLPPDSIYAIRCKISAEYKKFKKIVQSDLFQDTFELQGDKLVNGPKGFDKEDQASEFLKFKWMIALHKLNKNQMSEPHFATEACRLFKLIHPFNQFLEQAISASSKTSKSG